jgi:hypothetical protein
MGRLQKIIGGFLTALFLIACDKTIEKNAACYAASKDTTVACDLHRGYTYKQPAWIFQTAWQERSVDVTSYSFPLQETELENFKRNFPESPYLSKSPPICSSLLTGSSQLDVARRDDGSVTMWGRVDAWDRMREEGWESPQIDSVLCNINGISQPVSIYAFCAQKDDRTVVICVNEMRDNPNLAEDIFKSFRWTK